MVLEAVRLARKNDRTKTIVLGMTALGLVEMTRKKIRQELSTVMTCNCSYCEGTGRIISPEASARSVLKQIKDYLATSDADAVNFEVHTSVHEIVKAELPNLIKNLGTGFNKRISFSTSKEIKNDGLGIKRIDTDSMVC